MVAVRKTKVFGLERTLTYGSSKTKEKDRVTGYDWSGTGAQSVANLEVYPVSSWKLLESKQPKNSPHFNFSLPPQARKHAKSCPARYETSVAQGQKLLNQFANSRRRRSDALDCRRGQKSSASTPSEKPHLSKKYADLSTLREALQSLFHDLQALRHFYRRYLSNYHRTDRLEQSGIFLWLYFVQEKRLYFAEEIKLGWERS